MWLDSCIHAREWAACATNMYMANQVCFPAGYHRWLPKIMLELTANAIACIFCVQKKNNNNYSTNTNVV